jgi:hypothetical protein
MMHRKSGQQLLQLFPKLFPVCMNLSLRLALQINAKQWWLGIDGRANPAPVQSCGKTDAQQSAALN